MKSTKSTKPKSIVAIDRTRQKVFVWFWALGHLMNNVKQGPNQGDSAIEDIIGFVLFMICVSLLFKPSNTKLFITMAGLSVIQTIGFLPKMPNHWMILGLINTAILVSWVYLNYFKKNKPQDWFVSMEPLLRLSFLTCYGAAALAKLNSSFMDTSVSCAVTMAAEELGYFGLDLNYQEYIFIPWAIALVELSVFLLPFFTLTRPYGVILASLFHLTLSLTPVSQGLGFSFTLWPLLLLFVPTAPMAQLVSKVASLRVKIGNRIDIQFIKFVMLSFFGLVFYRFMIHTEPLNFDDLFLWLGRLALGIGVALVVAYLAWLGRGQKLDGPVVGIKFLPGVLVYAIVLFNVLTPYLGIKTYATMTMYSNLKVENGTTNHYLFPRLPFSGLQDDLVKIISSSFEPAQARAESNYLFTWLEFQRVMSFAPNASVTYERNGELVELEFASDNPELVNPNPILLKLISHRPVSAKQECLW